MNALNRFKPYPMYKDSGVEWLGEIPAHWDAPKMWRISKAMSGGTPAREERTYWDGEIPWVSPKDMKRRIIDSSEDTITEQAIRETGIRLIDPPVVLIVVRGMILAHSFPVAVTTVPVTINQDMKALTFRGGIDPLFAEWTFEGIGKALLAAIVEEAAHGTRAIRMDQWRSVTMPVPPEPEQRAIAAFLDRETARIDALVAKKERLIELLHEKRTALITRAVTKGLDPTVPMKDSGVEWLGEIPAQWEVTPIGRKIVLQRGVDITKDEQNEGDVPVVSSGGASSFHDRALAKGPGVVVGRKGTAGSLHYVECDFWPHDTTLWVREFRGNCPRFVYFKLSALDLASFDTGTANPTLNRNLIHPVRVSWPPIHEQLDIAASLDREGARIDTLIAKVRDAIDRLKELRTALISAAVTGKIDVREEAA